MRTYSGYLLIEDLLDDISNESPTIYRIAQGLINPTASIVEADCGTLLGKRVSISFSSVGLYDLALGERLTRDRLILLLSQGEYVRRVRHPAYCASLNGVCSKCAGSVLPEEPAVGSSVQFNSEILSGSFSLQADAATNSFVLDVTEDEVDRVEVFVNSLPYQDFSYSTTSDGYLQVEVGGVVSGTAVDIKTWKLSSTPYISFLSKTYSGSILGAAKMEGFDLPLRQTLLRQYTSEGRMLLLEESLAEFSEAIPDGYLGYAANIRDPLEKALYLICLYGIFHDLEA